MPSASWARARAASRACRARSSACGCPCAARCGLVVLDEPNSNLDGEGDEALTRAILSVRARGGIVVVVAHRPSALAGVDLIMEMRQGRAAAPERKDEFIKKRQRPAPMPPVVVPAA